MNGYAIVLASSERERVQAVSISGSIAAMSDLPVQVFVTMDGLRAFERETAEPTPVGVLGLARATRDPAVKRGLGYLLALARALGPRASSRRAIAEPDATLVGGRAIGAVRPEESEPIRRPSIRPA